MFFYHQGIYILCSEWYPFFNWFRASIDEILLNNEGVEDQLTLKDVYLLAMQNSYRQREIFMIPLVMQLI